MTFEVSAGRAVTPQEGQIGARPTSALSPWLMLVIIPSEARSAWICLDGARMPHIAASVLRVAGRHDRTRGGRADCRVDVDLACVVPALARERPHLHLR